MNNVTFYYNGDIVYSKGGNKDPLFVRNPRFKRFFIDPMARRCIISAAKKMAQESEFRLILLTGTFPFDPSEREASKIWVNFMNNLKKTYKLKNYVWTKERQKNGRIHYHLLAELPFSNISAIQNTYNTCIKNVIPTCTCSNNSLRLPDHTKWRGVVDNSAKVAAYIAKYVSKASNNSDNWYIFRCYQISKGLFPLKVHLEYMEFLEILRNSKKIQVKYKNDYGAGYFLKD